MTAEYQPPVFDPSGRGTKRREAESERSEVVCGCGPKCCEATRKVEVGSRCGGSLGAGDGESAEVQTRRHEHRRRRAAPRRRVAESDAAVMPGVLVSAPNRSASAATEQSARAGTRGNQGACRSPVRNLATRWQTNFGSEVCAVSCVEAQKRRHEHRCRNASWPLTRSRGVEFVALPGCELNRA